MYAYIPPSECRRRSMRKKCGNWPLENKPKNRSKGCLKNGVLDTERVVNTPHVYNFIKLMNLTISYDIVLDTMLYQI